MDNYDKLLEGVAKEDIQKATALLKEDTQRLRAVMKTLEWSYPTPELALSDGACPSCFAGKPLKFWAVPTVRPTEFERENHMKVCQLADALEQVK